MRPTPLSSLLIFSIPYFAAISSIDLPRISGLKYQGFIWFTLLLIGLLILAANSESIAFPLKRWLPWYAYVALSLLWSPMSLRSNIQVFLQVFTPLIIGLIASTTIINEAQWDRLRRGFFHCLIIIATIFVAFWYGPFSQYMEAYSAGVYNMPGFNARSASMTLSVIGCIYVSRVREDRFRSILGWLACLSITALSGSRMGTVVLLSAWIFLPIHRELFRRLIGVASIFIIGIFLFYTPIFQERFFYSGEGTLSQIRSDEFADQGRFLYWEETFEESKNRIFFGHGIGESDVFISGIYDISQVHNDYLRILFELGIIGLIIFLVTVGSQLIAILRRMKFCSDNTNQVLATSFLVIISLMMFASTDNGIIYNLSFSHPLFAVLGAAYGISKSRNLSNRDS